MGINCGPPPKLRRPRPSSPPPPPPQHPPMQNSYVICVEDNQCKGCGAPILNSMDNCAWCGSKTKKILKKEVKYVTKKNEELPKPYDQEKFTFLHTVESRFFNKSILISSNGYKSIVIEQVFINMDPIPNTKWELARYIVNGRTIEHYINIKQKLHIGNTVMVHFHESHLAVFHE